METYWTSFLFSLRKGYLLSVGRTLYIAESMVCRGYGVSLNLSRSCCYYAGVFVPVERSTHKHTHTLYTHEHTHKFSPVRPGWHTQMNDATLSWQVDPCAQAASWQSSMFSLQSSPVQPFTHLQYVSPNVFTHVPPFWHPPRELQSVSVQYWPRNKAERVCLYVLLKQFWIMS